MEETNQTDPATNKKIRVSVTARKHVRQLEEYASMRNVKINEIIAKDFADASNQVMHHFVLNKKGKKEIGEIRGMQNAYYISAIRDGYIDILTIVVSFKEPKYRVKDYSKLDLGN